MNCTTVKEQPDLENCKYRPPPISGTVEERCQSALEHVSEGLDCLKYFPTESGLDSKQPKSSEQEAETQERRKPDLDEATQNMAKPFQAIPMPYAPLNKPKTPTPTIDSVETSPNHKRRSKQKKKKEKAVKSNVVAEDATAKSWLCKQESRTLPTWEAPKKSDNPSWNAHLKTLLYEKSSLVFAVLAENEYSSKNYGSSLRYILAVLRCQKILEVFCGVRSDKLISYLLGRAGDCCFMTVQDWANVEKHRLDYEIKSVTEERIIVEIYTMNDLDMSKFYFLKFILTYRG